MADQAFKLNSKELDVLIDKLIYQSSQGVFRIAIDGFLASGKTTIANAIKARLEKHGRPIIRATTDDFQNPPEIRWRLGENSPEGFYLDSINWDALIKELLLPLSLAREKWYRTSIYDIHNLKPNYSALKKAEQNAILIFDGLFLQIPQVRAYWDIVIFIDATYEACISRAIERNQEQMNSEEEINKVYRTRYMPGYEMYRNDVDPVNNADIVLLNDP